MDDGRSNKLDGVPTAELLSFRVGVVDPTDPGGVAVAPEGEDVEFGRLVGVSGPAADALFGVGAIPVPPPAGTGPAVLAPPAPDVSFFIATAKSVSICKRGNRVGVNNCTS